MPTTTTFHSFIKKKILQLVKPQCPFCLLPIEETANYWCHACMMQLTETNKLRCYCCASLITDDIYNDEHSKVVTNKEGYLCHECQKSPPLWHKTYCISGYDSVLKGLIHQYKYQKKIVLASTLAQLLVKQIEPRPSEIVLIPVPLHWKRHLVRGFNQAEWLAFFLAQALNCPVENKLFKRVRHTSPQQKMRQKERQENLIDAFRFNLNTLDKNPLPKHVAIIDDVVTTGSTILELANLLKEKGVERIDIYCLAKADLEHRD